VLVVRRGADQDTLLGFSISPDATGLSSSVCRVVKQFCKGTSDFMGNLFLLLVLREYSLGNIASKNEEKAEILYACFASVLNGQTGYS